MGKKISLGAAITMMVVAATITFAITMVFSIRVFNDKVSSITERESMYEKFTEIDKYVRQNYTGQIDEDILMDAVANGYMSGIDDPFALYMNAKQYSDYISAESDIVAGVGIISAMEESGYMQVTQVLEGTAAAGAGIQVGDLIIKIDDIDITAETYDEAVALLTGDAGTKVNLMVRRENEDTEMEITRRQLTVTSVYSVASPSIGNAEYIRIDAFNESSPEQFSKVVDSAVNRGASALIFDLRNVSEGLYPCAATMLDKLLPEGDMLSVIYNNGVSEVLYSSNARSISLPMVVLIDENTSGAAEFFAGAIRDFDKCKIIGAKSSGNGALQDVFKLDDGSAVKLTVGTYSLGISNTVWDSVGITVDHEASSSYDGYKTGLLDTSLDAVLAKGLEVLAVSTNSAPQADPATDAPSEDITEEPVVNE